MRRNVDRGSGVRQIVHAAGATGRDGRPERRSKELDISNAGAGPLPPLPAVRKDDEPPELRAIVRHHRGHLQRTRDVSRSRRAASGRRVHPGRGTQPDARSGARAVEGRAGTAAGSGDAPEPKSRRGTIAGDSSTLLFSSSGCSASSRLVRRNVSRAGRSARRATRNARPAGESPVRP